MNYNIAIDGPAGAGKSTIAKKIAQKLEFIYVDTGALYRAMAYFFVKENLSAENMELVSRRCMEADITIRYENKEQQVYLNNENVTPFLRTEEAGKMASLVSSNPTVRQQLLSTQQKIAETNSVVMDGRDIGTCVLPGADLKIYLTASSHTRAQRRFQELKEKKMECDLNQIEEDIIERDKRDMTREISPLQKAEDATLVDSSDMTIEEVVDKILKQFEKVKQERLT